jgi:Ser/Thr protein kinase RdoA (MazF antagonist)
VKTGETGSFYALGPDTVLDAVEASGLPCDGRLLALNSYENRVYQVGIEDRAPVVVKFYRPNRWSDEAIVEEHAFSIALAAEELPVAAPIPDADGVALRVYQTFRLAIYSRLGGHAPELDSDDTLLMMGRFLARMHNIGALSRYRHRPSLDPAMLGEDAISHLLSLNRIPPELNPVYEGVARDVMARVEASFEAAGTLVAIRTHGDCHAGNVLWTDGGPHFVDLDDSFNGPAVQDLWMLLAGDRVNQTRQLGSLLDGYEQFREFDRRELALVEALRSLRMLNYSVWLARRWDDPAFPRAFPWFDSPRYWEEQILALREQMAALDEPPLVA